MIDQKRQLWVDRVALGSIMMIAAAWWIYHALTLGLSHDEWWHVFFGEVQPFSQALREIQRDTHPPLSYLLIRLMSTPGDPTIWSRMSSILPALATLPFLDRSLKTLGIDRYLRWPGILFYSTSSIMTSLCMSVRSYGLCFLFAMIFLSLVLERASTGRPWTSRQKLLALASSVLAPWSLYASGLLILLPGISLVLIGAIHVRRLNKSDVALISVAGASFALLAVFYAWTSPANLQDHVGAFFPSSGESSLHYFERGLEGLFSCFGPWTLPSGSGRFAAILVLGASLLAWKRRHIAPSSAILGFSILFSLCALALLGRLGIYPFGGLPRHQFPLFPWLFMGALTLASALLGRLGLPLVRASYRSSLLLILILCWWKWLPGLEEEGEFISGILGETDYQTLSNHFEPGVDAAIYSPCLGQLGLYANFRLESPWVFKARLDLDDCSVDRFETSSGTTRVAVYRDRNRWALPQVPNREFVKDMSILMTSESLTGLWIYNPRPQSSAWPIESGSEDAWRRLSDAFGLGLENYERLSRGEAFRLSR